MFKHLMVALSKSKFEAVRKKIIKCLRVPMGISNEVQSIVKRYVGARLTDSDPGVRIEAFEKIAAFQIKIEDFDSPEIRMRIIKEGMSDQDENVLKSCLNFLTPSIIQTINIEVTENEISEMLSQDKPSISKNQSRRNSQIHEIEIIKQDVYNFSRLFKSIEVKQAFTNEYFVQIP